MQVVQHFLKWTQTAKVSERAGAAAALARAYLEGELPFEDRYAAEAALTALLDDPSSKVRFALAEALSMSRHAPVQVVAALASDQPDVAAPILARSPVLSDTDLIDRVADEREATQCLIARRPHLSMSVSAALAEVGTLEACLALAENSSADIAAVSFRRMIERHGNDPRLRERLAADPHLPSDCRHVLLRQLGETLRDAPFVRALVGAARAEKLTRDACIRASLTLIETIDAEEHGAMVEHLRIQGELTTSFIVRLVAHGKIDFFGHVLMTLTGESLARIGGLLVSGRDLPLAALFKKAGLAKPVHAPVIRALAVWREVAQGKRIAGAQEVSWLMLESIGATPGQGGPSVGSAELAGLLRSIHLDALRENARIQAQAIAAA
ncbi:DUF2336 domain-containing protein [Nitratireductor kimnyeongensis]|uniref:DUF2336 domain-containing protein n=1 Tax=Nitratireductor kimnyeongensis TaxID=430679 RepID=A0ABW0TB12_9HYPH|nr:DUF2336 domain-containing protein [Nitratireductor kimnyeongensis]QZZ35742.1 DUF2336 domain-containing protein [Nitratireductor kimnyeongensis]